MVYVGADIGGTKVCVSAAVLEGNDLTIVAAHFEETTKESDVYALSRQLIRLTEKTLASVSDQVIEGYGISSFGPFIGGSIDHPANLTAKGVIPIINPLKSRFGENTRIELGNDGNCAALTEYLFRTEENADIENLVYLTWSTGIGGGIVDNGRLVLGKNKNAMEVGHVTVAVPSYFNIYGLSPRKCGCRRVSCLEAYASGRAIQEIAGDLLAGRFARSGSFHEYWNDDRFKTNGIFDKDKITTKDVFEASRNGDWLSEEVVNAAINYVAIEISNLINLLDPQAVFIGGGVTRQGEYLFAPLRDRIDALPALEKDVYVGPSQLGYNTGLAAPFALLLPDGRYNLKTQVD